MNIVSSFIPPHLLITYTIESCCWDRGLLFRTYRTYAGIFKFCNRYFFLHMKVSLARNLHMSHVLIEVTMTLQTSSLQPHPPALSPP